MTAPEEVPDHVLADIFRILHDVAPERERELREILSARDVHVTDS